MKEFNKEISVLHVATAKTWRGGEQQVAYLLEELRKKNIRQFVLCTTGSAMEKYCITNKILYLSKTKFSAFDLAYARALRNICVKHKISLVHTHDSHAHSFAVLAAAVFGNKANVIVSRRVDFSTGKSPVSKWKYNHKSVKRIICVSEKIKQIMSSAIDDPARLVCIHSGIDLSRFGANEKQNKLHKEYELPDSAMIVGNVAALAPHKDYSTFIKTATILSAEFPDLYFLIIGEGPERNLIQEMILSTSIPNRIIMTGFRNDIPEILPELDVFLITSETEGLGTSILDAFACDVPVVATAAGGIPELVIHEETGLLADLKDPGGLASNVKRILGDDILRNKLTTNARAHLHNFTRSATAAKTLTEYLSVTGVEL